LKILNFFKKLFTDSTGKQTSQIIAATHSPFIVHNLNRFDDKVIILQRDNLGKVVVVESPKFYSWSSERIVNEAFKIEDVLGNEKSIVFVEGETDERYFNKAVQISDRTDLNFEIKWIGRVNERGSVENTGDTALNQAKSFFLANMDFLKHKVVLLYDSDTNVKDENFDRLLIRSMATNTSNKHYKIGVENLLELPHTIDKNKFYKQNTKTDKYGAESIINVLDKTKLCNFICDELDIPQQKDVLKNVIIEIGKLTKFLK